MENDRSKFKKDFIKRLIKFSISILRFAEKHKKESILWSIFNQLIRSATSIGANVVEARASSSKRDYLKFFEIALKSANETLYWLLLLKEVCVDSMVEIEVMFIEANEIAKILASSVLTLKNKS